MVLSYIRKDEHDLQPEADVRSLNNLIQRIKKTEKWDTKKPEGCSIFNWHRVPVITVIAAKNAKLFDS